jgi:hypothetical protein
MPTTQVFLSAVTSEFQRYRNILRRLLKRRNLDIHVQEDFIATGTETLEKLDDYIKNCDAVIHLVGKTAGALAKPGTLQMLKWRYPNLVRRLPVFKTSLDKHDPVTLSYTQWEAYLAIYHKRALFIALPAALSSSGSSLPRVRMCRAQQLHLRRLKTLRRYPEIVFRHPVDLAKAIILRSKLLEIVAANELESKRQEAIKRITICVGTTGARPSTKNLFRESRPFEPSLLEHKYVEGLGKALGQEMPGLTAGLRQRIPVSSLSKIVPVNADMLLTIEHLSAGRDLMVVRPMLESIIRIGKAASEKGVINAKQLLFDAMDKLVHCDTFVLLPNLLRKDTGPYLEAMAAVAVSDGVDWGLLQRYWARRGDVLKICGYNDPVVNHAALAALRMATELGDAKLGYHSFRSLCIVAARSNMADREFDKIIGQVQQALQNGRLDAHEEAPLLDGLTEAFTYRYEKTKKMIYLREALKYWGLANYRYKLASTRHGEHVEFSLRIDKLPIILANGGIIEPFGKDVIDAREYVRQTAVALRDRAEEFGSDRVVDQMTSAVIRLDRSKS